MNQKFDTYRALRIALYVHFAISVCLSVGRWVCRELVRTKAGVSTQLLDSFMQPTVYIAGVLFFTGLIAGVALFVVKRRWGLWYLASGLIGLLSIGFKLPWE